jgi:ubiquinone/menaquinone biosynthesis C-methylase UbiE
MTAAAQKAYKGMGMEGSIARWYEKTTGKDLAEFEKLARRLEAMLAEGGDVLEVAPGPGFLSVELARNPALKVTGLDISKTFVELGRRNADKAGVVVDFREGNASAMPFEPDRFDLVVCRAAFKNFSEPQKAIEEMHRVLRPGGSGLIIDLSRDTSMREIRRYFEKADLGLVDRWFTIATFRFCLLKRAFTKSEMETMLRAVPFRRSGVRMNDIGLEAWFEK